MMKILQFGEGNFLRAFADWMIDVANEKGVTDAEVTVVPPRFHNGRTIEALQRQGGRYHVVLEGIKDGKPSREVRRVECIKKAFSPDVEPEAYDSIVCDTELRFVISNTTEAGIVYVPIDREKGLTVQPDSFPGKVAWMLYRRFKHFGGDGSKGIIFICCELIEDNGRQLREIVLRHARELGLEEGFTQWVQEACIFCDSLVDRIVSGKPAEGSDELPAETGDDEIVVCGEMYHLWVIGTAQWQRVAQELPLHKAGLHVEFADSCNEFRDKKVRILNGCHTAMMAVALQMGVETVREAFGNSIVNRYIAQMVESEILPMIEGEREALRRFADGILGRFANPYIHHRLTAIAVNSLSKWEVRNWPTVKDVYEREGRMAVLSIFSFAALMTLYASPGFTPQDTDIERLGEYAPRFEKEVPGFMALVTEYVSRINTMGMAKAIETVL